MGVFGGQQNKLLRDAKAKLYNLINHATAENLSSPNFGVSTDAANVINQSGDPYYLSNKACKELRKRLRVKNAQVQKLSLALLEGLVSSCGEPFHSELASSDLFPEVIRLADNSSWCPPEIQAEALALVQEWAYALKPSVFVNAYNGLKSRGFEFPDRNQNGTSSAARFQAYPGLGPGPVAGGAAAAAGGFPGSPTVGGGGLSGGLGDAADAGATINVAGGAAASRPGRTGSRRHGAAQLLSPTQPAAKLLMDLEVARNTTSLFDEVLDGCGSDPAAARADYVADMADQVRAMKARLGPLVERASDERVLAAALDLNDDAQRALDRHAAALEGRTVPPRSASSRRFQPLQSQGAGAAPTASGASAWGAPPAETPAPSDAWGAPPPSAAPQAPPPRQEPLVDLLSLDDWEPAPSAQPPLQGLAAASSAAHGAYGAPAISHGAYGAPAAPAAAQPADPWGADAWGQTASPTPAAATQPSQPLPASAFSAGFPSAAPQATNNPFADEDPVGYAPPAPAPAGYGQAFGGDVAGSHFNGHAAPTFGADAFSAGAFGAAALPDTSAPGQQAADSANPFAHGAPEPAPPAAPYGQAAAPHDSFAGLGGFAPSPGQQQQLQPLGYAPQLAPAHSAGHFEGAQAAGYPAPSGAVPPAGYGASPAQAPVPPTYGQPPQAYGAAPDYSSAGYPAPNGFRSLPPGQAAAAPSDAFADLASVHARGREVPTPPKGAPMRRGEGEAQTAPVDDNLAAFDAFDAFGKS